MQTVEVSCKIHAFVWPYLTHLGGLHDISMQIDIAAETAVIAKLSPYTLHQREP